MFEVLSQYPERAKRFGNAMDSYTKGTGYDLKHIIDNYPWETFGNGTVVDVSLRDTRGCHPPLSILLI